MGVLERTEGAVLLRTNAVVPSWQSGALRRVASSGRGHDECGVHAQTHYARRSQMRGMHEMTLVSHWGVLDALASGPKTVKEIAAFMGIKSAGSAVARTPGIFICGWKRTCSRPAAVYYIRHGPTPPVPTYTRREYDQRYRAKLNASKPRRKKMLTTKKKYYLLSDGRKAKQDSRALKKTVAQIDPVLAALLGASRHA